MVIGFWSDPSRIQIGMVGSEGTILEVAGAVRQYVEEHPHVAVVLDPVMNATPGGRECVETHTGPME